MLQCAAICNPIRSSHFDQATHAGGLGADEDRWQECPGRPKETAFDVLNQAKALEAQGKNSSTWRSASPTSTPRPIIKAAAEGAARRQDPLRALPACPSSARPCAESTPGRSPCSTGRTWWSPRAPSRSCSSSSWPWGGGGRGHLSRSRLPHLRVHDQLRRGQGRAAGAAGRERLRLDLDELKSRSPRRPSCSSSTRPTTPPAGCCPGRSWRRSPACREHDLWVLSDEIYGRILYEGEHVSIASFPACRTNDHPGRLLQDLRHDRLAAGLRHVARGAGGALRQAGNNNVSCTATFIQSGLAARSEADVAKMVAEFTAAASDRRGTQRHPRHLLRGPPAPSTPSPT